MRRFSQSTTGPCLLNEASTRRIFGMVSAVCTKDSGIHLASSFTTPNDPVKTKLLTTLGLTMRH